METERRFAKPPVRHLLVLLYSHLTANLLKVWLFQSIPLGTRLVILCCYGWVRVEAKSFSRLLWEMTYFKFSVLSVFIRAVSPNKKGFKYYPLSFKQIFAWNPPLRNCLFYIKTMTLKFGIYNGIQKIWKVTCGKKIQWCLFSACQLHWFSESKS